MPPEAWTNHFAVIDVETTGTDPRADRIVEIAVIVVRDGKITERWTTLLNPGMPIPEPASAVNGITDAMVADAPTFAHVAIDLAQHIEHLPIVAYNAPFDRAFIGTEWQGAQLQPAAWCAESAPWIDPLVWVREAQKYNKGKTLTQVAARLGIEMPEGSHRALADAITCARVIRALRMPHTWSDWSRRTGKHPKDFFPSELHECVRAQEALRRAQDAERAEWLARQASDHAK